MDLVLLWAAAFGAGVVGAMGLGGGGILMLYLTTLELTQRAAQGINLLFILPVGLAGLWFHRKNGLIEKKVLLPVLIGGAVGVLLGSLLAGRLSEPMLRRLFGILIIIIGIKELWSGIQLFKNEKGTV
ncbi:MAG: sulfite exporter TauE/SafE family protein [Angelakisella sp.]